MVFISLRRHQRHHALHIPCHRGSATSPLCRCVCVCVAAQHDFYIRDSSFSKNKESNPWEVEEAPEISQASKRFLNSHCPSLRWFNKGQDIEHSKMKEIKFIRTPCVPQSLFIIWQLCNLKELNSTSHGNFINRRAITYLPVTWGLLHFQQSDRWTTKLSPASSQELKFLQMTEIHTCRKLQGSF